MLKIVVLISGSGSNLQAIIDAIQSGALKAEITGVLSNKADAGGLTRAEKAGIATAVLMHGDFLERDSFDQAMQEKIDAWAPDIVVLAGFMRILTPGFVAHYSGRLLNIHPSLLPKYKGLHTHRRALEAGDTTHGCSVHLVTAELDGGPVIAQSTITIQASDTETTLADRIHKCEHQIYPQVLIWIAEGMLRFASNQIWLNGALLQQPAQLSFTE
jgi:phosphoribosylglycinamide formyltransferase-1